MTSLAIIEDDAVYRSLLEQLVQSSRRFRLHASFDTAEAAVQELARRPVDIALVDLGLPGQSGIDAIARLRERCPRTRCVVITGSEKTEPLFAALEAGAAGYLLKTDSPLQILAALDELLAGGAPMSRHVARQVVASFSRAKSNGPDVSDREREIMDALAHGLTYKEIGGRLGISAATVKNHLSRIYEKIGVRSRTEAVVKWLRR